MDPQVGHGLAVEGGAVAPFDGVAGDVWDDMVFWEGVALVEAGVGGVTFEGGVFFPIALTGLAAAGPNWVLSIAFRSNG